MSSCAIVDAILFQIVFRSLFFQKMYSLCNRMESIEKDPSDFRYVERTRAKASAATYAQLKRYLTYNLLSWNRILASYSADSTFEILSAAMCDLLRIYIKQPTPSHFIGLFVAFAGPTNLRECSRKERDASRILCNSLQTFARSQRAISI